MRRADDDRSRPGGGFLGSARPARGAGRPQRRQPGRRPALEPLELRVVLSPTIYTVDSTGGGASGTGSSGTLPYVVAQADADPNPDGSEIQFDPSVFATAQTITLGATLGLTEAAGPEVIDGPGAGLVTVSGGGTVGVVSVGSGVTATVSGLTISGGSTDSSGGGVYDAGALTLSDCTISDNTAFDGSAPHGLYRQFSGVFGGGVYAGGAASLTLSDCSISGNTASGVIGTSSGGGGVGGGGAASLTLSDCSISGNTAAYGGGGVYGGGTASLTLSDCSISGNTADVDGGGLDGDDFASLTLSDCSISGNTADRQGGGVLVGSHTNQMYPYTFSTMALTACTVSGNTAGEGGGLSIDGKAMLADCTISGDTVARYVGLYGGGGGVYVNGTATITACTISGNTSSLGGGGVAEGVRAAPITLTDTIVAGNTGDDGPSDISDSFGSVVGTYDLIGTGGSGGLATGTGGNIVLSSDAGLGLAPLGDYGGPTQTMALLPGSPALAAGTAVAGLSADQRGGPLDSPPDIGAFQVPSGSLVVTGVTGVAPGPRDTPVSSLIVTLNQSAGPGDFAAAALTLTDDGGPNLITGTVSVTLLSGSTYMISGLAGLTTADGAYTLTVNGLDIFDATGAHGSGSVQVSWLIDTTPPTPTPTPAVIVGEQPVFRRELNKKGKPVGKAELSGFALDFGAALDAAAATNPANYRIDAISTRRVKKRVKQVLHPITRFTVTYSAAAHAITIAVGGRKTFATGGQITVLSGVTTATGAPVSGPTVFAIARGGKGIAPE